MGELLHKIFLGGVWLIQRLVLRPLSWAFGLAVWVRNRLYDREMLPIRRYPVRIISIGNISAGGTGKTPMAELLLTRFLAAGLRPAYLSRGYGRRTKGYRRVNPDTDTALTVGDEALQVAAKFPAAAVAVAEDRCLGVENLLAHGPLDVIILDDAFQHRRLHRDLDLVMIDANRPPWRDRLLPEGRLRERIAAVRRADLIVVNKVFEEDKIRSFQKRLSYKLAFTRTVPRLLQPFAAANPVIDAENKHRRACVVFSGIGNHEQFVLEVHKMGLLIMRHYRFGDHLNYRPGHLEKVARRYKRIFAQNVLIEPPIIVTTEKDYVRLRHTPWFHEKYGDLPFYYLIISLEVIRGAEEFEACLAPLLQAEPKS